MLPKTQTHKLLQQTISQNRQSAMPKIAESFSRSSSPKIDQGRATEWLREKKEETTQLFRRAGATIRNATHPTRQNQFVPHPAPARPPSIASVASGIYATIPDSPVAQDPMYLPTPAAVHAQPVVAAHIPEPQYANVYSVISDVQDPNGNNHSQVSRL